MDCRWRCPIGPVFARLPARRLPSVGHYILKQTHHPGNAMFIGCVRSTRVHVGERETMRKNFAGSARLLAGSLLMAASGGAVATDAWAPAAIQYGVNSNATTDPAGYAPGVIDPRPDPHHPGNRRHSGPHSLAGVPCGDERWQCHVRLHVDGERLPVPVSAFGRCHWRGTEAYGGINANCRLEVSEDVAAPRCCPRRRKCSMPVRGIRCSGNTG